MSFCANLSYASNVGMPPAQLFFNSTNVTEHLIVCLIFFFPKEVQVNAGMEIRKTFFKGRFDI